MDNPLSGLVYRDDAPFCVPFPKEMLKVVQDQYTNNEEARGVRLQEVLCPFFGDPESRTDLIALFVEHLLIEDDGLADVLFLDIDEVRQVWEARPISLFDCLVPSCRASLPVRNRTHLLRLLRVERYFGLRVGAGDPVEFKTLCQMLCESCAQGLQHSYAEQRRADLCVRQDRIATNSKMSFTEYQKTPEWGARRRNVLLRAGYRCELCYASGRLQVHHRTYDRYGNELLSDLIALCRSCHQRFHGVLPEAA